MKSKVKFRGAVAWMESHSAEGGRLNVKHERPGADKPTAEDVGGGTPRFTIECFTIGKSYREDADAFVKALEAIGPGKLEHPSRGTKTVAVEYPYRERETTQEGGMVRFTVTFFEVGKKGVTAPSADAGFLAKAKALDVDDLQDLDDLDVSGPDFLTQAVRSILAGPQGLTNTLSKINNGITQKLNLIDEVSASIDDLSSEINTLLNTPNALAGRIQGLINSVFAALGVAADDLSRGDKVKNLARVQLALSAADTLGTFGDLHARPTQTTTWRSVEGDNRDMLVDLVETAALGNAVTALVDLPLDNSDQASDAVDALGDIFDRLLERESANDDVLQALRDMRALFFRHMRRRTVDLTGLDRVTPPVSVPALVLAYRLYGEPERDEEIVERNPDTIDHPGFLHGGVELAVASV